MNYSQKYTLAAFIEPVTANLEFNMNDWPLHVTLADVFAAEINDTLETGLRNLLANIQPVSAEVGDDTILGITKVALIKNSEPLQNLHEAIVSLLQGHGATFNTPEFNYGGFLPHVTIQTNGRVVPGEIIRIASVSLIDMFPNGDWKNRSVMATFELGTAISGGAKPH